MKEDNSPPIDVHPSASSMDPPSASSEEERVAQPLSPVTEGPRVEAQVVQEPSAPPPEESVAPIALASEKRAPRYSLESTPPTPSEDPQVAGTDSVLSASSNRADPPAESANETPSAPHIPIGDLDTGNAGNSVNGDASAEPVSVVYSDILPEPITPIVDASTTEPDTAQHGTPNGKTSDGVDVEALQNRLKLVEQRFAGMFRARVQAAFAHTPSDVSTSFKRLQAEKLAADRVLRELTSVESVAEVDALQDFLQNMNFKAEVSGLVVSPAFNHLPRAK